MKAEVNFVKNSTNTAKQYPCSLCGKGFVSQKNLMAHNEKYHKDIQMTPVVDKSEKNDKKDGNLEEECMDIDIDEDVKEKCNGKIKKDKTEMEDLARLERSKLRDKQILEKQRKYEENERKMETQKRAVEQRKNKRKIA